MDVVEAASVVLALGNASIVVSPDVCIVCGVVAGEELTKRVLAVRWWSNPVAATDDAANVVVDTTLSTSVVASVGVVLMVV